MIFAGWSVQLPENFHAGVDAQLAAVQADMIVLGVAPFHIGIEAVVGGAALILVPQPLLRRCRTPG